ncbi:hypothetical protein B296_00002040 [Ensete ventricosum]|uniref:Uncharacterized protein n=1 Tax=Ensete ventricosum TaxID=4639 RepID=A0A427BC29_ENSVE|nr:hypothetical protein B296_00002040 [Ensete ventricosum]
MKKNYTFWVFLHLELQLFHSFQHMPVEIKRLLGNPTVAFNKRNMVGTLVYIAAEFLRNCIHTEKSDVYGFAVFIKRS